MTRQPRNQGNQRRLIYIAPGKMLAAGHVIEFVAEKSVMPNACKLQSDFRGGQSEQQARGAAPALAVGQALLDFASLATNSIAEVSLIEVGNARPVARTLRTAAA